MSDIHLNDIRRSPEKAHWKVVEELDGDGYSVSGVWVVERPDGTSRFHLGFQRLDHMRTLPIEQSYGCAVRESPQVSCYFSRQARSWPQELADFEKNLKMWQQD